MNIMCTLTARDLASAREHWLRLFAAAGVSREQTPSGLRLRFRNGESVTVELERLVNIERECCAWATWTVSTSGDELVLDVTTSGDGIAVLHHMFTEGGLDNRAAKP